MARFKQRNPFTRIYTELKILKIYCKPEIDIESTKSCISQKNIRKTDSSIVHYKNDVSPDINYKQDKYTMDPGSQIDRRNQKIIFSKK